LRLIGNRDNKYIDSKRVICAYDQSSASDLIITTIFTRSKIAIAFYKM